MTIYRPSSSRHPVNFRRSHACTARYRHGGTAAIYPLWYIGYKNYELEDVVFHAGASTPQKRDPGELCSVIQFRGQSVRAKKDKESLHLHKP